MSTTYYVDSHGSNTAPYDTWAKAANDLATAIASPVVAGDTIYVAHNHSESGVSSSLSPAGNLANQTKIICANSGSGEPPTTLATTASCQATGAWSINSSWTYVYGINWLTSSAVGSQGLTFAGTGAVYDSCTFKCLGSTGGTITFSGLGQRIKNASVLFSAAASNFTSGGTGQSYKGITLLAGGTSPTNFFGSFSSGPAALVSGVDLSNASSGVNLFGTVNNPFIVRNVRMPASWSGTFCTQPTGLAFNGSNIDSTGTNYRFYYNDTCGVTIPETSIVHSGGASDGTTPESWKITSNASATFWQPTSSPEFVVWIDTTGSSKVLTVEFIHDSVTALKDDDIWLELEYLGTSGGPVTTLLSGQRNLLGTGANQASSVVTWNNTGSMTNPNKQKLTGTITTQLKGYVHGSVKLAKASYTVYIDPPQDPT